MAERIVDERKKRSKIEYMVKWLNWPDEANTWEPKRNILYPSLLDEWKNVKKHTKVAKSQQVANKRKRVTRAAPWDRRKSTKSRRALVPIKEEAMAEHDANGVFMIYDAGGSQPLRVTASELDDHRGISIKPELSDGGIETITIDDSDSDTEGDNAYLPLASLKPESEIFSLMNLDSSELDRKVPRYELRANDQVDPRQPTDAIPDVNNLSMPTIKFN